VKPSTRNVDVVRVGARSETAPEPVRDVVAVEEPLQVQIAYGPRNARRLFPFAMTMRTPGPFGTDEDLAAGLAFSEGLLRDVDDLEGVHCCGTGESNNVVRLEMRPGVAIDEERFRRNTLMSSACGLCGRTTIDSLREMLGSQAIVPLAINPAVIHQLPHRLREAQTDFARTGGLHAAGLFDTSGELLLLREDIGRHNAVDKVVGSRIRSDRMPLAGSILLVSGRASYELTQKAIVAGVPVLAAVGAPSSLAVDLAREFGLTLLGFVRDGRFNVYSEAK
jgi:FdhD protein